MSDEPMNVIVSVIIPVYNAAKYISGTLDTILSQSLKDIEIIIVNDNSTDNTLDVITQIASEDSRVRIINNPLNVGGGESRNIGLRKAIGEYVIFLDDDDYVTNDMLKIMSDQATTLKSDVVICRCQSVDLSTNTYSPMPLSIREDLLPKKNVFSSQEIANDFFRAFIWWPWDKLFRREAILAMGLEFQALRTTNDLYFVCCFILLADRISLVDEILISHTINRAESLSSTRENSWHCALDALTALHTFIESNNLLTTRGRDFNNYAVVFLEWNLNTVSGPSFNLLLNDVKSFIISLNIDEDGFYDDFIKSAYLRIINQSAEEYIFSLKDRILHELEQSHMSAENLQLKVDKLEHLALNKDNEINDLNLQIAELSESIKIQTINITQLEQLNLSLDRNIYNLQQTLAKAESNLKETTLQIKLLRSSLSWKITKPFRNGKTILKKIALNLYRK
ncbi:glycosyltransferase [Klebsiella aerogenes]|uniref:glycosyltransferase family 2 protein n=1 Tax=Klebsiella TaxID=570 RepID=UPI0012F6EEE1|nr:glycosyltransferase family 2 protein [Klebsiella aerogenes]EIY2647404.1 glycosyltransferase [Klebsiella aerogenes]EKU2764884.1 glycosyltransferase [Klebsiella aerogenes]ELA0144450.1 glycosyltransferase [Klebsiella aerogenes]ELA2603918.1 glycosyltransferase [Klebsiella aerogenes]ELS6161668.1 glycosyltransferase [Klebsiella aerogenes]